VEHLGLLVWVVLLEQESVVRWCHHGMRFGVCRRARLGVRVCVCVCARVVCACVYACGRQPTSYRHDVRPTRFLIQGVQVCAEDAVSGRTVCQALLRVLQPCPRVHTGRQLKTWCHFALLLHLIKEGFTPVSSCTFVLCLSELLSRSVLFFLLYLFG
jgi:hypothetical protein